MEELKFLEEQGVNPRMIEEVRMYREEFPVDEAVRYRVVRPLIPFYGKEILEMAIAALLQGENLLLTGSKATGKTCWRKTWPIFSTGRPIIFHSMSIPAART